MSTHDEAGGQAGISSVLDAHRPPPPPRSAANRRGASDGERDQ